MAITLNNGLAQCVIPAGVRVVATDTPPCTGTITVNGTIEINTSINWTDDGVIHIDVNGSGALLDFPQNQNKLYLAAGSTVTLSNGGLLDTEPACTNNDKIYIGETFGGSNSVYAYASCNGSNATYSFSLINDFADGIVANASATNSTPCLGGAFTLNVTSSVIQGTKTVEWSGTGPSGYTYSNTSNVSSVTFAAGNGLVAGTYTFTAKVIDGLGNYKTSSVTVTVGGSCDKYWTGALSTAWNVAGNWNPSGVPASSADVIIPNVTNDPVISTNVVSGDIDLQAGATLNVDPSGTLTLNGVLSNAGTVTIENAGSFLQGSGSSIAGSGSFLVQRQGDSGTIFNYWSTPVANYGTVPGTSYAFNPATSTQDISDDGYDPGWSPYNGTMMPGVGYAGMGAGLVTFSGAPNNGNVNIPLKYTVYDNTGTQTTPGSPFNLVGNPYPSAISASALIAANPDVFGTIFFWDDDLSGGTGYASSDYAYWNGTGGVSGGGGNSPNGYIASGQGFMVRASSGSSVLNFTNTQRVSGNNSQHFKTAKDERSRLWLSVNGNGISSQILVGMLEAATDDEDRLYDAVKMHAGSQISLSAVANNTKHAIIAFPPKKELRIVPLTLTVKESGTYSFKANTIENFDGYEIYLLDEEAATSTLLDEETSSEVELVEGEYEERFFLKLISLTAEEDYLISEREAENQVGLVSNLYPNPSSVAEGVQINIGKVEAQEILVIVYDMTGRESYSKVILNKGQGPITAIDPYHNLSPGIYLVIGSTKEELFNRKLIIE
ncbi:T9SS type A sorting domain-containing protein [Bacteroidota bacterium]